MSKPELEIFRALSGHPSARLRFQDGRRQLLHSAVMPEREADYLGEVRVWSDVVILLGVGLGYHLGSILSDLQEVGTLILIDAHPECLNLCERFIGRELETTLVLLGDKDSTREAVSLTLGRSVQVIRHPASYRSNKANYDAIVGQFFDKADGSRPARSASNVMVLCGRFFFQEEICFALEKLGLGCTRVDYEDYGVGQLASHVEERFAREQPVALITVGFKGCDAEGHVLNLARRFGVPVAVWFVDDPRPNCLAFQDAIHSDMYAFCWEKSYMEWLSTRGFGGVEFLPLAACSSVFHAQAALTQDIPVSFVGSAMGETFLSGIRRKFLWDPSLQNRVEQRAVELLSGRRNVFELSHAPLPFDDPKNLAWFTSLVIHTASAARRAERCGALLEAGLVLVGDPEGWRAVFGNEARCLPSVDYKSQLGEIYQRTQVNINVTSCQMPSAVNQRLFDVPLAGGFLLSDDQADIFELFDPNTEVVTYGSNEELSDKVEWYSSHLGERLAVIAAARSHILAEHCVEHRVQVMLVSMGIR